MRVLIISAFFPPLNNIASQRLGAFEKYLRQSGVEVDVITRYYDPERSKGKSMHIYQDAVSGIKEAYIRKDNVLYTNYDVDTPQKKRFQRLPPGIRGLYAYLKIDVYAYGWITYVQQAFEKEFSKNQYDFIIASYGPPVTLLAAKKLSDRYGISYIADYRDIFINENDRGYHLALKKKQQNFLLSKASGILFVSEGMRTFFNKHASSRLRKVPAAIVMNGVDDFFFGGKHNGDPDPVAKRIIALKEKHSAILLHTGTVYPGQNITFFTNGLKVFNKNISKPAAIVFVGFAEDIRDKKALEAENVYFFDKVDINTSMYLQQTADVLLLPVWEGRYTGFSGKLLEYLAVENRVLMAPGMQQDVLDFVSGYENIIHLKNENELLSHLQQLSETKMPKHKNTPGQNEKLRRSYWVEQLAGFMFNLEQKSAQKK